MLKSNLFAVSLTAVLFVLSIDTLVRPHLRPSIDSNRDKVVTIVVGNHLGSGAYVSPSGTILTCAHLFLHDAKAPIFVRSASGTVSQAFLLRLNKADDLAVIRVFPVKSVPYFKIGEDPHVGDPVITYGSPLGISGTVTRGYVENTGYAEHQFTIQGAPINPGNSGGPLVDEGGYLIGVNVSMHMLNILVPASGLYNAVNLAHIRAILRD